MALSKEEISTLKLVISIIIILSITTVIWDYYKSEPKNEFYNITEVSSFSEAKKVINGSWLSQKKYFSKDCYKLYSLNFDSKGIVTFSTESNCGKYRGEDVKDINTIKGVWTLVENTKYLEELKANKVFHITIELEGWGAKDTFNIQVNDKEVSMETITGPYPVYDMVYIFDGLVFNKTQ